MSKENVLLQKRLLRLSKRLADFEVVPGLKLPAPRFDPPWTETELETLRTEISLPPSFEQFVSERGGISAMDIAGGVAFLSPGDVRDHLGQDFGRLLASVGEAASFPFAVTGSGSYLLLTTSDGTVWKFNVHMHPVAKPERVSLSFEGFLDGLANDWERVLVGGGAPYSTS